MNTHDAASSRFRRWWVPRDQFRRRVGGGRGRRLAAQSSFADQIRSEWQKAGRVGGPTIQASLNFAVGGEELFEEDLRHLWRYSAFTLDYCALSVADMVTTPEDARDAVRQYRDLGFDRLLLHPAVAASDQVDRLADAVL